jgi:predicted PurR-regulated permease PerM
MTFNDRQKQTMLWAAVALVICLVLWKLGPILTPFAAALVLAYMLLPGVDWLTRKKLPRILAVVLVITLTILVVLSSALIVAPIVSKEAAQIKEQLPTLLATLSTELVPKLRAWFGLDIKLDSNSMKQWIAKQMAESGDDIAATVFAFLRSGSNAALQILGLLFLVPVVLFYLLLDWPRIMPRLKELVPQRWLGQYDSWTGEIDSMLSQYLRGQLLVMLSLAAFYSVALLLARFELWLPIGVLTGLLIFIPYLGFALGALFALAAGILQFGFAHGAIAVLIVYGVGQILESIVLTPRLVGERIGLHPVAVIFALMAFGLLFGFVGILLALPLAAALAVGLRRLRGSYIASPFYNAKA